MLLVPKEVAIMVVLRLNSMGLEKTFTMEPSGNFSDQWYVRYISSTGEPTAVFIDDNNLTVWDK